MYDSDGFTTVFIESDDHSINIAAEPHTSYIFQKFIFDKSVHQISVMPPFCKGKKIQLRTNSKFEV